MVYENLFPLIQENIPKKASCFIKIDENTTKNSDFIKTNPQ